MSDNPVCAFRSPLLLTAVVCKNDADLHQDHEAAWPHSHWQGRCKLSV